MNKKELREYKNQFDKDNYKQFKAKLKPEELDQINEFLAKNNMNKRELVLEAKKILERGIYMRKFLVVKVTQHFNDQGFIEILKDTKKSKVFDNKNEAEKFYNSIKLKTDKKDNEIYSDFKGLFQYDACEFSDETVQNNAFELDELKLICDETNFSK
ncbi:MAG TPA: hypothetical protein IAD49_03750 [Candidatus Fimihabitans intestinipullorum]|uniref:Uncharacterized protein n=1 Tax=Candidatus Fimihabitans intestinipullorum TaxID=2840820 RepID=A0A9D1HV94_9BACT|nr:hypothetical protein [Candidatus Fimihabitans intestinipullorum]